MTRELYISIDIESDGPIPGPHSMLSLGAAAFELERRPALIETFSANLKLLPDANPDPDTMKFWSENQASYDASRTNAGDPKEQIGKFVAWVNELAKTCRAKPVAVCYPVSFDFMFVYWYIRRFEFTSPFGFHALDLKTLGMSLLRTSFRESAKRNFPEHWFSPLRHHTHVAVDDAIEQGEMFVAMLKDLHRNV